MNTIKENSKAAFNQQAATLSLIHISAGKDPGHPSPPWKHWGG